MRESIKFRRFVLDGRCEEAIEQFYKTVALPPRFEAV